MLANPLAIKVGEGGALEHRTRAICFSPYDRFLLYVRKLPQRPFVCRTVMKYSCNLTVLCVAGTHIYNVAI